jgi:hypothetical protein
MREQQREVVTCPNLFTIQPMPQHSNLIKKQEWQIQLYCYHPDGWRHPAGEPYIIEEQREWLQKALPHLRRLLTVLRVVAPAAGAALAVMDVAGDKSQWARQQQQIFDNEVKAMDKLLKAAQSAAELGDDSGRAVAALPRRSDTTARMGEELVAIRGLMDQLAAIDAEKGRPKWGGLTRQQTVDGQTYWLCGEHLDGLWSG